MSADLEYSADSDLGEFAQYRELSRGAIVTVVVGVLSLLAVFVPSLLIVPLVGVAIGLISLWNIRRRSEELAGGRLALAGIMLCVAVFAAGTARAGYEYLTECPEGYARVSFYELQPDPVRHPDLPVSPRALELNGKKVFIKGYVYPDGQRSGIKQFVLIPDMGTCCFGGQPKLTDMVEVTLADPLRIRYSYQRRKLTGVLRVDTTLKPVSGVNGVYYQIEADSVR
jgi:hypothetical protein